MEVETENKAEKGRKETSNKIVKKGENKRDREKKFIITSSAFNPPVLSKLPPLACYRHFFGRKRNRKYQTGIVNAGALRNFKWMHNDGCFLLLIYLLLFFGGGGGSTSLDLA